MAETAPWLKSGTTTGRVMSSPRGVWEAVCGTFRPFCLGVREAVCGTLSPPWVS